MNGPGFIYDNPRTFESTMTFLDVLPAALTMQPIRARRWVADLWIRWNYSRLVWQWIDGEDWRAHKNDPPARERAWQDMHMSNGCLTPMEMLKPEWEVYTP